MDLERVRREAETPSQANQGDLEGVVGDLSDAFSVDPLFDWFMRADDKRAAARLKFFRLLLTEMAFGIGRIDRPASGGAAAVWLPSTAMGPNSVIQELRALPTLLGATGWSRFPRMLAMRDYMDKHHPLDRPHAYLWFLGVRTEAQGHGIGSRLLRSATVKLDTRNEAAYLETDTDRNVALYKRHGFAIISEGRARTDAPLMWGMWRDPQPSQ